MLRYAHAVFNQVAQSAARSRFHPVQQRCCRWLLMTHDRMQSNEFLLTQEFLAMMLGVQRTGVTAAASALQRQGLIHYRRGNVTILDRRGLERRARVLRRFQAGVRSPARRSRQAQGPLRPAVRQTCMANGKLRRRPGRKPGRRRTLIYCTWNIIATAGTVLRMRPRLATVWVFRARARLARSALHPACPVSKPCRRHYY